MRRVAFLVIAALLLAGEARAVQYTPDTGNGVYRFDVNFTADRRFGSSFVGFYVEDFFASGGPGTSLAAGAVELFVNGAQVPLAGSANLGGIGGITGDVDPDDFLFAQFLSGGFATVEVGDTLRFVTAGVVPSGPQPVLSATPGKAFLVDNRFGAASAGIAFPGPREEAAAVPLPQSLSLGLASLAALVAAGHARRGSGGIPVCEGRRSLRRATQPSEGPSIRARVRGTMLQARNAFRPSWPDDLPLASAPLQPAAALTQLYAKATDKEKPGGNAVTDLPTEILEFWLDRVGPTGWYRPDPDTDAEIRDRFETAWTEARGGHYDHWLADPRSALALLILLDQFPRNMFRGSRSAYASDRKARAIAKRAIDVGHDRATPEPERQFFYIPLMHSETLPDQERCVRLIALQLPKTGTDNLDHAQRHREVIRRFGRFPSRNALLGRTDTEAERAYREQGGYMA